MEYKNNQRSLLRSCLYILLFCLSAQASVSASENIETVIESDKQLFAKALKLSEQGLWSDAERIYRDLLKRNDEWPEPKNNLAIILLKTNRLDEARLMFEQAVTSTDSYRIAQNNRTQLYNYMATQAYEKALGSEQSTALPEMQLIETVHQPVKVIEKKVEVIIEKPVVEYVDRPVAVTPELKVATPSIDEEQPLDNTVKVDSRQHIKQQLLGWSRAWSQGDFEHYIESYSADFIPSDARKSFAEWKNIRRARLKYAAGVNVIINEPKVYLGGQGKFALVEFIQQYKSATYSDKVLKQMYMQKQQDNWLILSERTIKTY